jgi:hypothetical protein
MSNNTNKNPKSEVQKLQDQINALKSKEKVKPQQKQKSKPKPKTMMESPPRQQNSKKSPTGASYKDGFDCISPPDVRDIRIEEFDELIATVTGQTAFTIIQYAMNPGNSTTFPRLSRIAQLFEKYSFEQLEVYFQHDVSQYATQGQQGLVLLSALYDAASAAPTTKTQIEACKPRVICMPNQNSLLRLAKERMHPRGYPLFIRPSTLPGGTDIKTYDIGNMFLTVQGMVGAGEVGELHVRGRVKLYDEILDASSVASPSNNQIIGFVDVAGTSMTTTVPLVPLFATSLLTSNLSVTNASGVFTPAAGLYKVLVHGSCIASGGSMTKFELFCYKNASLLAFGVTDQITCAQDSITGIWVVNFNGTDTFTAKFDTTFPSTCVLGICQILFEPI